MYVELIGKVLPILKKSTSAQALSSSANGKLRAYLLNDEVCATSLLLALRKMFGTQFMAWEPETLWLELNDRDIDMPTVNRGKILAVTSLIMEPAFYWDATIFEKTALSFNDEVIIPGSIQEASPAQLSWAVFEAEMLLQAHGSDPDFDHEPQRYAATSMFRDGLILAPEFLVFAQEELDKLPAERDEELAKRVRDRWMNLPRDNEEALRDVELDETPEGVQVAKLVAVHLYMKERATQYEKEVLDLA
jgi:hypothetical protein